MKNLRHTLTMGCSAARVGVAAGVAVLLMSSCGGEPADEMALVPAGLYVVGPDAGNEENGPVHGVRLEAFEIDLYEVTNREFRSFIGADDCPGPLLEGNPDPCVYDGAVQSVTREDYWDSSQYYYFPVINVRWDQAEAYCRWKGKRLPTEAEWEAAARGVLAENEGSIEDPEALEQRDYPWGSQEPDCSLANFEGCESDTMEVGSLEAGISPFGVYDMAGNVSEWIADYYNSTYYSWGETDNPQGPTNGTNRAVRGGSWFCTPDKTMATFRDQADPLLQYNSVGFRCARSIE